MNFLNPALAIAGAACVAIPIIIHLLMRRRRRPVEWAAMRFLVEAYRKHKRRLRLEQLLLLAARCLVVLLIGLALGRPLLGAMGARTAGPMTVYLLVDNSLAASARGEDGRTALERHVAAAERVLEQLDSAAGDRAGLIALGGPAEAVVAPASYDVGAVRELVRELRTTDSAADLEGAIRALGNELGGGDAPPTAAGTSAAAGRAVVVVLSDFLVGTGDVQRAITGLKGTEGVTVLASAPAERGAGNVTVESVEPLRPVVVADGAAQGAPVRVRLRRSGPGVDEPAVTTVRLAVEGAGGRDDARPAIAGQGTVRWSPGQTEAVASVAAELPAAARSGETVLVATVDADAVAGDNAHRRPVEVRRSLRVGVIAPRRSGRARSVQEFAPADWYRLALTPTAEEGARGDRSEIEVLPIDPASVDAARLSGLDAAIVARPDALSDASWRRLRAFAESGGLVLVSPPAEGGVHLWVDAMARELGVGWSAAREARAYEDGAAVAAPQGTDARDLLALIGAELAELAAPVRVWRVLPVDAARGEGTAVLSLEDGTPLVLAARPGSGGREGEGSNEAPTDAGAAAPPAAGDSAAASSGRGLVVMLAAAPSFEWTDLPARPLMVPLVQELVRQGIGRARPAWSATAGTRPEAPARSAELVAADESGGRIAVGSDGRAAAPVRRAGVLRAVDERGATRGIVTVNADALAGRTDPQPAEGVRAWLGAALGGATVEWIGEAAGVGAGGRGELRATLDRGAERPTFALPLLLAALGLAVLELAMARWFSHAAAPAGAASGAA